MEQGSSQSLSSIRMFLLGKPDSFFFGFWPQYPHLFFRMPSHSLYILSMFHQDTQSLEFGIWLNWIVVENDEFKNVKREKRKRHQVEKRVGKSNECKPVEEKQNLGERRQRLHCDWKSIKDHFSVDKILKEKMSRWEAIVVEEEEEALPCLRIAF